jgi:hypothetical protein
MNLSHLDLLFWAMSFIGNVALLLVLLLRGRFRNLPIFTALITLNVVRTIALFLIRRHNAQSMYFYTFWSLAVLDVGLQFAIVYELSFEGISPTGTMGSRYPEEIRDLDSRKHRLHFPAHLDSETIQSLLDAGTHPQPLDTPHLAGRGANADS